jgi:hypothetical protein
MDIILVHQQVGVHGYVNKTIAYSIRLIFAIDINSKCLEEMKIY